MLILIQPLRMLSLFYASILLLTAVELLPLLCINFISVKLFERYYGLLDALILIGVISRAI